jgi:hypothetical protein
MSASHTSLLSAMNLRTAQRLAEILPDHVFFKAKHTAAFFILSLSHFSATPCPCLQSIALCQQLPYAMNVTLDCTKLSSMPNISFVIGGKPFSIPVGDYAYQVGVWVAAEAPTDYA